MPLIEEGRLRCRAGKHKPGCAHLGLDPTRLRCRGDKHKPGCEHLNPKPPGRPRTPDKRSAGQAARHARQRAISIPAMTPASPDITPLSIERETPQAIPANTRHLGPPHEARANWQSTSCLCSCHFPARSGRCTDRCDDGPCLEATTQAEKRKAA